MGRSQKIGLALFFAATICSPLLAFALTYSETFTATTAQNTSAAVWNIGRGDLHPPLWVENWNDGGPGNTPFSVGDGHHGAFNLSTYAHFGTVVGTTIQIDTDVYPDLQFTSFDLDATYVILPIGSQPLIIRSQTDMIIDGLIECSGADGTNGNATSTDVRAGGGSRCGGGAGGASGIVGTAGTNGGIGVTGGGGGPVDTISGGQGGGGGGSFKKTFFAFPDQPDPTAGVNPAGGIGGIVGTINRDDAFVIDEDGAGAGGGGGSAFNDLADVPNHGSGGSGGGGGGNIRLYAVGDVTIGATGDIRAKGGNGGDANKAGGGGGGSGGSILIFAGGDIQNNGSVVATPGTGGNSLLGGDGGAGAVGRTWLSEKDNSPSGNLEVPLPELNSTGNVHYELGAFIAESNALDFLNTAPVLTSSAMTLDNSPASGTALFEIAQSSSPVLGSFGIYADVTTLVGLPVERFFRFRLTLTNTSPTAPIRIQDISMLYTGHTETEFDFKGACGRVAPLSGGPWLALFFLPFLLVAIFKARMFG